MTHFEDDVPVSKVEYVSPPEGNPEPQNEGFLFKGAEVAPENKPFCPKQIHFSMDTVRGFLFFWMAHLNQPLIFFWVCCC